MEQRNWQVWLAIALGGLALLVALSGRSAPIVQNYEFARPDVGSYAQPPQPPQAPQAPQAERPDFGRHAGPGPDSGFYREYRGSNDSREGPFMGMHGRDGFRGGPFGHRGFFFGPFVLISILFRLAGVGLLLFLLVRLFKKQRASATPPAGS